MTTLILNRDKNRILTKRKSIITMCKNKNNTELIVKIIKETTAYVSGGIDYVRKRKSVLIYNPHGKDFKAIALFNALGIFRVTIKYDKSAKKVYLKVK